ncbi:NUDIX domain-containing protein [Streptomyces durbertensis]|uniref:NUDIX domain-containing protein n=1 Tax=Streptomyces durbertensis TaxID=2448886 RepID=A0ABR6EC26_9ACTN|nr:NUDIX domain-containing protein [Streptomyces durbertensis]MBB1242798.1 NUDIX domain-containing protein [Streptomyces durbertensis]
MNPAGQTTPHHPDTAPAALHADAARTLHEWAAPDAAQDALRRAYLDHLDAHPDGMWKACRSGHLTASALVIDPAGERVLLTLHRKLEMWLQMGGHCEPEDGTLAAAALREATEESGIGGLTLLPGGPVRLDRHSTPCAVHLDVQYAALAPPGAAESVSEESLELRWYRYADAADLAELAAVADDSVLRLVTAARQRL